VCYVVEPAVKNARLSRAAVPSTLRA
jgi:hypothetical protein